MNIVIIGKNESPSILKMWNSVKNFGNVVFVLDRCTDDSERIARENKIPFLINQEGNLSDRKTSSCRNLGYSYLKFSHGLQDTLFLDCDRYITSGDLGDLTENSDVELLMVESDLREPERFNEKCYGRVYNDFFSCGILLKKNALLELENFYSRNAPDYGSSLVFPESVEKYWGIEDTLLGDICYHLGLSAEINKTIRLRGEFEKTRLDSLDVIEQRFILRDKLNVMW